MSSVRVLHGDCLRVMRLMRARGVQVDSIVTDPPYHLSSITRRLGKAGSAPIKDRDGLYARQVRGFMGKQWDGGDIAMNPETWALAYDLLKPGGHMIALCGTRTEHRVACAIEDAGFDIRDRVLWLYGSGFPKSHDVSKAVDKAQGASGSWRHEDHPGRPGARKKADRVIGQVGSHATDDNPEGLRHVYQPATDAARQWEGWGTALKPAVEIGVLARKPLSEGSVAANVLTHGTGAINVDGCRISTGENLNGGAYSPDRKPSESEWVAQGGTIHSYAGKAYTQPTGRWPANVLHDGSDEVMEAFAAFGESKSVGGDGSKFRSSMFGMEGGCVTEGGKGYGDIGTPARFFYSAKADKSDRLGSKHPTVKPVDLMAYLARLITPPGGLVLDPFAGSGTTGMAAIREGFRAVLIEREAEYVADIHRRLQHVRGEDTPLFQGAQTDVEDLL